jgi:Spy/CpxP family protein refolding chaperone
MKHKKIIMIAAVSLVMGLLLSSCVHHSHFSRHKPEHMLRRIDKRAKSLDLTETQKTRYNEIRKRLENDLQEDIKKFYDLPDQIGLMVNEENPDMEEMAELLKMRMSETPALRGKYIDYFVEFYTILDEEQKQQVLDHINRRIRRTSRYMHTL